MSNKTIWLPADVARCDGVVKSQGEQQCPLSSKCKRFLADNSKLYAYSMFSADGCAPFSYRGLIPIENDGDNQEEE